MPSPPLRDVFWEASCRLVASRYPPILLFDSVADPADLEVVFAVEALGNPRLRELAGELSLVPPEHRISGEGTSCIMAAFTHLNAEGSRFSDGSYGVYYAANDLETAVAEVSHHRARFLARTAEPAIDIDMRCYRATIKAALVDLRDEGIIHTVMDPDSYAVSQQFARERRQGSDMGIAYGSVRRGGGQCVALFTPKATVPPARQAEHITLQWDGERISGWYQKSGARPMA